MAEKGFTSDGFIMDQAQFTDYPYGKFTSDWNGCGWIAVFNLMHARGMGVTPEQICQTPAQGADQGEEKPGHK